MTPSIDLDDEAIERLLAGHPVPGYDSLQAFVEDVALVASGGSLRPSAELALLFGASSSIGEARSATVAAGCQPVGRSRWSRLGILEVALGRRPSRRLAAKLGIVFGTLTLTGTAAAATNSLPDFLQDPVASAVEHIGIDLPGGEPVGTRVVRPGHNPHLGLEEQITASLGRGADGEPVPGGARLEHGDSAEARQDGEPPIERGQDAGAGRPEDAGTGQGGAEIGQGEHPSGMEPDDDVEEVAIPGAGGAGDDDDGKGTSNAGGTSHAGGGSQDQGNDGNGDSNGGDNANGNATGNLEHRPAGTAANLGAGSGASSLKGSGVQDQGRQLGNNAARSIGKPEPTLGQPVAPGDAGVAEKEWGTSDEPAGSDESRGSGKPAKGEAEDPADREGRSPLPAVAGGSVAGSSVTVTHAPEPAAPTSPSNAPPTSRSPIAENVLGAPFDHASMSTAPRGDDETS